MDTRTLLLVLSPIIIISLILQISAIVSIVKKPVMGNDKIIWLLISLFINPLGPILYFAVGSTKLDEKAAQLQDNEERYQ